MEFSLEFLIENASPDSKMKVVLRRPNISKTRFKLMVPLPNHDVTKNMTGHRMHVEGPQIS